MTRHSLPRYTEFKLFNTRFKYYSVNTDKFICANDIIARLAIVVAVVVAVG